jgi:hypothetical protein
MTLEEAMKLKVGDMVIFYDRANEEIVEGHTFYFEVVNNKNIPADLGLIVEVNLDSDEVKIDWLSDVFHGGWCSMAALHDIKLA